MKHCLIFYFTLFSILLVGFQSCSWDTGHNDMFYMRNTLPDPVLFGVLPKDGVVSEVFDTVFIQPGERCLVHTEGGIGHVSPFLNTNEDNLTGLIYDKYGNAADRLLMFADSSYVIYGERNYRLYEKHPYHSLMWRIIEIVKKTNTFKVEYLIDELDYQNAQQGE